MAKEIFEVEESAPQPAESAENAHGLDALRNLNAGLQTEVGTLVTNKEAANARAEMMDFDEYPLELRQRRVAEAIASEFDDIEPEDVHFQETKGGARGDVTIMVRKLMKLHGNSEYVSAVAPRIKEALERDLGLYVEQKGIFVNVEYSKTEFVNMTLATVEEMGEDYGNSDRFRDKRVVVDFSSPNIAKTMHVGHLRSTIIGQVMINLLNATGAVTYGINHLGDWGTTFGQLITAYKLWADEVAQRINPDEEPVKFLAELYAMIKKKIGLEEDKDDKPLTTASHANFAALEAGDSEMVELWDKFRELSLVEFSRMYERLGIKHDLDLGESFYEDRMADVIERAKAAGAVVEDKEDGSYILSFELPGQKETAIFVTADGRTVYATRDVAAIKHRIDHFKPTDIYYVIGTEQDLHMRQIFEVSRRIGDIEVDEENAGARHVNFGLITHFRLRADVEADPTIPEEDLEDITWVKYKVDGVEEEGVWAKISSRKGANGLAELLDDLADKALGSLQERAAAAGIEDADPLEQADTAEKIATGALIFGNFTQGMERDMKFDDKRILTYKGGTCPYLQYTCVRLASLLERHDTPDTTQAITSECIEKLQGTYQAKVEGGKNEDRKRKITDVAVKVAEFPSEVAFAVEKRSPDKIATYLLELANLLNKVYTGEHLSKVDEETRSAYLRIFSAANITLRKGLKLLNIQVPDKM